NADDLVALDTAGCLDLGDIARFLADQGARDRRADRDEALLQVGLVITDDLVRDLRPRVFLFEIDGGTEDHPALRVERRRVDGLRRGELAFDLEDAALDEALLVLGRLVFGILGKIALGASFGDRLDHGMALDRLQPCELLLEFVGTPAGEWNRRHHRSSRAKKKPPLELPAAALLEGSLVQFGGSLLQDPPLETVAVLHAFDRRLAAGHACVVGDAMSERGLADVPRIGDRGARLVDGGEDELYLSGLDHVDDVRP